MSTHQQVGDFKAVKVGGQVQKNGGNVASYFCTPDGSVIHSVAGPVSGDRLLAEAQWAVAAAAQLEGRPLLDSMRRLSAAHMQALPQSPDNRSRRIHQLLAARPLAPIERIYDEIFGDILGQRISLATPRLKQAVIGLELAKKRSLPVLFVIHEEHQQVASPLTGAAAETVEELLRDYVVVQLPQRDLPALSHYLGRPPYETPGRGSPVFVITDSQGEQYGAAAGWSDAGRLSYYLAVGMLNHFREHPPRSQRRLIRTVRLMERIDEELAEQAREIAASRVRDTVAMTTQP